MGSYFFWDIENVSFHNLERVMQHVHAAPEEKKLYVVYSRIKESRKKELLENGWELVQTAGISKNSADNVMKEMIESIIVNIQDVPGKIYLITEDKGFYKTAKRVIMAGFQMEVVCGSKDPGWVKKLFLT
ncbi:MAG TPA: hypothetical protein PK544_19025 [Spirochaetota bacterium]|nr:hypothetical protein [Spirochaetota bacterium]